MAMVVSPQCCFLMPATMGLPGGQQNQMQMNVLAPMAIFFVSSQPESRNQGDMSVYQSFPVTWSESDWQPQINKTMTAYPAPQKAAVQPGPECWSMQHNTFVYGAEAPAQQMPMNMAASHCMCMGGAARDVPVQYEMNPAMSSPQMQSNLDFGDNSPRQRRNLDFGDNSPRHRRNKEQMSRSPASGVEYAQIDEANSLAEVDADIGKAQLDAQAREMAVDLVLLFRSGDIAQQEAVASFRKMAFTSKLSSHAAQVVLTTLSRQEAATLAQGLRGYVSSSAHSKHSNHVLQKIIEVLPLSSVSFIVDELRGVALEVAQNTFGCRVLCRILEHLSETDLNTMALVDEIVVGLDGALCNHPMASFVVRHILEHGAPSHKHRIVQVLQQDVYIHGKDKFGSHCMESALQHAHFADQAALTAALLHDSDKLVALAGAQFGRHVAKALLTLPKVLKKGVIEALRPREHQLRAARYGKSVVQSLKAEMKGACQNIASNQS